MIGSVQEGSNIENDVVGFIINFEKYTWIYGLKMLLSLRPYRDGKLFARKYYSKGSLEAEVGSYCIRKSKDHDIAFHQRI